MVLTKRSAASGAENARNLAYSSAFTIFFIFIRLFVEY